MTNFEGIHSVVKFMAIVKEPSKRSKSVPGVRIDSNLAALVLRGTAKVIPIVHFTYGLSLTMVPLNINPKADA